MAKLKIPDPRDPTNPDKVSKFGYVNVVTNLFKDPGTNYKDFLQTADDKRPDKLQGFAGTDDQGRPCVVTQLTKAGVQEAIDNSNCLIEVHVDQQKIHVRSKHNMSVPEERPTDFYYLTKYTQIIHDYIAQGSVDDANKFLFGIMLLTRCR